MIGKRASLVMFMAAGRRRLLSLRSATAFTAAAAAPAPVAPAVHGGLADGFAYDKMQSSLSSIYILAVRGICMPTPCACFQIDHLVGWGSRNGKLLGAHPRRRLSYLGPASEYILDILDTPQHADARTAILLFARHYCTRVYTEVVCQCRRNGPLAPWQGQGKRPKEAVEC